MVKLTIIGVDCAAQANNTGLARAIQAGKQLVVEEACCATRKSSAASIVADWVKNSERALLALDAPLGWPVAFGTALVSHQAGDPLAPTAHAMFRRLTDDVIYARLGKRPLEVAADRIARAAHAALRFLEDLRQALGYPVEVVWSPKKLRRIGVIEVYPAATRMTLKVPRGPGSLAGLESRVRFRDGAAPTSEHARDAVVCAISGMEFLAGRLVAPNRSQREQARREGWIWAGPAPSETGQPSALPYNHRLARSARPSTRRLHRSRP